MSIYTEITRVATATIMSEEAAIYDAILASDGDNATFDIPELDDNGNPVLDDDGNPVLLVASITPGKPRVFITMQDGKPGVGLPSRTTDVFGASRSIMARIEELGGGGRSMRWRGQTYTIMQAKPHVIAAQVIFVELHCDINNGMFLPGDAVL